MTRWIALLFGLGLASVSQAAPKMKAVPVETNQASAAQACSAEALVLELRAPEAEFGQQLLLQIEGSALGTWRYDIQSAEGAVLGEGSVSGPLLRVGRDLCAPPEKVSAKTYVAPPAVQVAPGIAVQAPALSGQVSAPVPAAEVMQHKRSLPLQVAPGTPLVVRVWPSKAHYTVGASVSVARLEPEDPAEYTAWRAEQEAKAAAQAERIAARAAKREARQEARSLRVAARVERRAARDSRQAAQRDARLVVRAERRERRETRSQARAERRAPRLARREHRREIRVQAQFKRDERRVQARAPRLERRHARSLARIEHRSARIERRHEHRAERKLARAPHREARHARCLAQRVARHERREARLVERRTRRDPRLVRRAEKRWTAYQQDDRELTLELQATPELNLERRLTLLARRAELVENAWLALQRYERRIQVEQTRALLSASLVLPASQLTRRVQAEYQVLAEEYQQQQAALALTEAKAAEVAAASALAQEQASAPETTPAPAAEVGRENSEGRLQGGTYGAPSLPPPPPPARQEYRPAPPVPGALWIAGAWRWNGSAYVWISGRWTIPGVQIRVQAPAPKAPMPRR